MEAAGVLKLAKRDRQSWWTSDLGVATLVFFLNVCDFLLTLTLAPFRGQELNPIFATLITQSQWRLVVVLKFLPSIVVMAAVGYLSHHLGCMPRLITWGVRLLLVEYTFTVFFLVTQAVILLLI